MSNSPTHKAFRLSVDEADTTCPDGRLSLHYLAMATSAQAAIEAVQAARGKPSKISVVDEGHDTAAIANRLRLADGQVAAL